MNRTKMLLHAYYEALYERLAGEREACERRSGEVLREEIEKQGWEALGDEKVRAYEEACEAFIVERLEMYNPIGTQYLFDQGSTADAFELEMVLNWYDGRGEYEDLVAAARKKTEVDDFEEKLGELAEELIGEMGAYPDRSIIREYEREPELNRLPDYVVARVLEEILV